MKCLAGGSDYSAVIIFQPGSHGRRRKVVTSYARTAKCREKGPRVNLRGEMPQTCCAQKKEESRKLLALEFAPLLLHSFAFPTKTICAVKEMVPVRR